MTKSLQQFQSTFALFVLLCAVSVSLVVHADDATLIGPDISPASLKTDSLSLADRLSQDIRNAVEEIRPSLVTIRSTDRQSIHPVVPLLPEFSQDYSLLNSGDELPQFLRLSSNNSTLGTGVIVSEDGLIWTSSDVTKNCESVNVTLQNNRSYEGRVVLNDADSGLAIIRIAAKNLPSVHFERRARARIADWAIAVAMNDRREPIISTGFISSLSRGSSDRAEGTKTIRFSFPVADDCGGCAFINLKGEFLGIHVPTPSCSAGTAYSCVALDTESAMALQRKVREDTAANGSQLDRFVPYRNESQHTRVLGHDRKEGMVSSLNTIREMLLVPPSESTMAAFASSVRNWLTSWQDASAPQVRPASNASELR